jgi:hypothetical protein
MTMETTTEKHLTPEACALRDDITGTPVEIDGQTWLFADGHPKLRGVWDTLYDHNVIRGRYTREDIQFAAFYLLMENYRLTFNESVSLIRSADTAQLVRAVETALFGPRVEHNTYSMWVESALYSNGLDPAKIPPHRLHVVLEQLVRTGRAIPPEDFISSQTAMAKRSALLNALKD